MPCQDIKPDTETGFSKGFLSLTSKLTVKILLK